MNRWVPTTLLLAAVLAGCAAPQAEPDSAPVSDAMAGRSEPANEFNWEELLPNARRPAEGVVSGGQPSVEQLAMASQAGFKTVINLRGEGEPGTREAEVSAAGMHYVALPIEGGGAITEANARALAVALEEAEPPVLLHCASGNRVGALLALKALYLDGKSAEEALQYGLDSGMTRLEPVVRKELGLD